MRLNISDEEDFQNQSYLWEANQRRSLKGRKGQAALRKLEAALLALPEKKLIADDLENKRGEVCALGALAKYQGKAIPRIEDVLTEEELLDDADASERASLELAKDLGVPPMVAVAIVYENDDYWPVGITPEQRYSKVLNWTRRQLNGPAR